MNLDTTNTGRPDPQAAPVEPIDECGNDECRQPIYPGDKVWMFDLNLYCCGKCLCKAIGAQTITI